MAIADAGYRAIAYDRRDDLAAVIEQTGARDAVIVGFSISGGEAARYVSRHGGKSVVQAVLVSSALPFRLKTCDNPAGTEQAAFDKTALALSEDRPKFLAGFFRTLAWARSVSMQASLKAILCGRTRWGISRRRGGHCPHEAA